MSSYIVTDEYYKKNLAKRQSNIRYIHEVLRKKKFILSNIVVHDNACGFHVPFTMFDGQPYDNRVISIVCHFDPEYIETMIVDYTGNKENFIDITRMVFKEEDLIELPILSNYLRRFRTWPLLTNK